MHRIDTPTAQKDKWGSGKNGWTNGDPTTGVKATSFNASFCDAIQEEICNAIEKSGIPLDPNDNTQLFKVLSSITTGMGDYLAIDKNLSEIADRGADAEKEARENIGVNLQPASTQPDEGTIPLNGWDYLVNILNMKTSSEGTELKVSAYVIVNPDQTIQEVRLKIDGGTYIAGSLSVDKPMNVSGPADVPLYMLGNQCGFGQSELGVIDIYLGGVKVGGIGPGGVSIAGQLIPTDYGNYDERYQAKGSYTPAGEAYTKAESDGRYARSVDNAGVYGIHTYAWLSCNSAIADGATVAGSSLYASGVGGQRSGVGWGDKSIVVQGAVQTGTWICCGNQMAQSGDDVGSTLYYRIA